MPIYEYSCKRCGDFEITQRMSEDPLKKCPTCGAKVTKLISTSAFHLKGSGWYMTDYGKSGASKSPDGDSSKTTETKESGSSNVSSEGASKEGASKTESSLSPSTKESSAST
jgi:putative FmdB family regulatory protein